MTNGLPLMRTDDGTGVSGTRPQRQFPAPILPIGSPFHDIAKTVVVKRNLVAHRDVPRHAQPSRKISPGKSRFGRHRGTRTTAAQSRHRAVIRLLFNAGYQRVARGIYD
jgi:hypothetical protein